MSLVDKAKENPIWTTVIAGLAAAALILPAVELVKAFNIDPIPWVRASEVEAVKKGLEDKIDQVEKKAQERDLEILKTLQGLQTEQKEMRADSRVLLRDYWESKKKEALDELRTNPESRTATRQLDEAEAAIRRLNRQARDAHD